MDRVTIESQASEIGQLQNDINEFTHRIRSAQPQVIAAVMARIAGTGALSQIQHGLRDACSAILQSKLHEDQISTMEKLDRSAKFLAWVGIALSAIIGIAQIIIPLFCNTRT